MSSENEVRFGVTEDDLNVLHDGVPSWMWSDLLRWIDDQSSQHRKDMTSELEARFDRLYRVKVPLSEGGSSFVVRAHESLKHRKDERLTLQFVDYLLSLGEPQGLSRGLTLRGSMSGYATAYENHPAVDALFTKDAFLELEQILSESGSKWTVSPPGDKGARRLVSRVGQATETALAEVVSGGAAAGQHLRDAWTAPFGMNPDMRSAHHNAVLAMEAAAGPDVSPKNLTRTLGTILRDMKNQGGWQTPLSAKRDDVVVAMMDTVWTAQLSRHAGDGFEIPTRAQAEAAVFLALAVVQLFTSQLVKRTWVEPQSETGAEY